MSTITSPTVCRHTPTRREKRVVSMGIERSSLRRENGLPLPIPQPKGNLWRSTTKSRKSTEEEVNCDATADSCAVPRIVKKYDSTCAACLGSGFVKTRCFSTSRFRSGRSTIGRCLLCGGGGFVRICTMRIEPDYSKDDSVAADAMVADDSK